MTYSSASGNTGTLRREGEVSGLGAGDGGNGGGNDGSDETHGGSVGWVALGEGKMEG